MNNSTRMKAADLNHLVGGATMDELLNAKRSIERRMVELESGFYSSKRMMKQERAILKELMAKINKKITKIVTPDK